MPGINRLSSWFAAVRARISKSPPARLRWKRRCIGLGLRPACQKPCRLPRCIPSIARIIWPFWQKPRGIGPRLPMRGQRWSRICTPRRRCWRKVRLVRMALSPAPAGTWLMRPARLVPAHGQPFKVRRLAPWPLRVKPLPDAAPMRFVARLVITPMPRALAGIAM